MGLREVAELPRAEAEAALAARTRQLAAYQRKWMRRIPGLVTVRAIVLRKRWWMTFSRWRAAGNEYLLGERAELGGPLTPERVREDVGGADGILEVSTWPGPRRRS